MVRGHLQRAYREAEPILVEVDNSMQEIYADTKPHIGYMGIALQTAFHALLYAPDFYSGLIGVVARGGDVDTNGAITGALLGAHFGIDSIPKEWRNAVRNAAPVRKSRGDVRVNMNLDFIKFDDALIVNLYNLTK